MEQPILIVSGDGHTGAPPEAYRDYIEPRYRGDIDRLIDENDEWVELAVKCTDTPPEVLDIIDAHRAIRDNGELGAWDMDRRLQELDREGVAGELLLPGHSLATLPFFGLVNRPCPPELRMAGTRAYHRWLADQMQIAPGRFYGIAEPGPCLDMDDTVKELRWLAAN